MSIKIKVYNQKAEAVGSMQLSDKVFGVRVSEALVHQAFVTQMANERQVLAHTKERAEVRGGGRKPWRQKGTGRARAGSIRSPIWIGGGVTFGPLKTRNFKKKINKKMKQKALLMVLSDKIANERMVVLEKLEIGEYKTKAFNGIIAKLEAGLLEMSEGRDAKGRQKNTKAPLKDKTKKKRSVLIINDKKDDKVKYSGRNLAGVEITNLENINIVDLLKYRNVIFTKKGIKKLEERHKS